MGSLHASPKGLILIVRLMRRQLADGLHGQKELKPSQPPVPLQPEELYLFGEQLYHFQNER